MPESSEGVLAPKTLLSSAVFLLNSREPGRLELCSEPPYLLRALVSREMGAYVQSDSVTGMWLCSIHPLVPAIWRSTMIEVSGFQGHKQEVRILVMPLADCGVMDKALNLGQEVRTAALYGGAIKTTEEVCEASPNEPVHAQTHTRATLPAGWGFARCWGCRGKPPHSA